MDYQHQPTFDIKFHYNSVDFSSQNSWSWYPWLTLIWSTTSGQMVLRLPYVFAEEAKGVDAPLVCLETSLVFVSPLQSLIYFLRVLTDTHTENTQQIEIFNICIFLKIGKDMYGTVKPTRSKTAVRRLTLCSRGSALGTRKDIFEQVLIFSPC